jgi:hypothetical protein
MSDFIEYAINNGMSRDSDDYGSLESLRPQDGDNTISWTRSEINDMFYGKAKHIIIGYMDENNIDSFTFED